MHLLRGVRCSLLVFSFLVALIGARGASAQCASNASTCIGCHETRALRPVLQSAQPWHVDHGFGDLCAACHAGDPQASEEDQAHAGLRSPLADPALACSGCHEQGYEALAAGYLAARPARTPPRNPPARASAAAASFSRRDGLLAGLAVLLAAALVMALRPARISLRAWPQRVRKAFRAERWSPVGAGAALGVLVAGSELWLGRPLAAAGAFDKLAAYAGEHLIPSSPYYRYIMSPGIGWQVWLMLGVLLGSFASSKLAGAARLRWLPDTQWSLRFGASRVRRLALAFVGAVLVQVGAGIAGGCTSGLAISGGAVLAPAAFVFMAGMFAGGVPTARLWYRRRAGARA